jgi:hypothetical protein
MFGGGGKSSLISNIVAEIRISIHLTREQLDSMTHTLPPGPYIQLTFAKSLRGRNRSSTLGMKSWFHSVRRPSRRPGLAHSPTNIHHIVAVTI